MSYKKKKFCTSVDFEDSNQSKTHNKLFMFILSTKYNNTLNGSEFLPLLKSELKNITM